MKIIEVLLAILLPPAGVFIKKGLSFHFWLSVVFTLCGYLPGLLYALIIILHDDN